ncbi:hypothetical protein ACH3O9_11435 [Leeuwenhoekiella sp. A16]|uniref:hypothetical protein n=1 Tax=Leeuwenhoekiella sp. A16 TaxID=3141462 RepID=UPI003A8003D1
MSLRILVNDIDIPYKKETLKMKFESNAFNDKFKAVHNQYPFQLIKTPAVLKELEVDRLQSTTKKVIIDCLVAKGKSVYSGKLILLEVFTNTIKADLIYHSALIDLVDQNIRSFMPVISLLGGDLSEPYSEETSLIFDQDLIADETATDIYKTFPERDYCFPPINFPEKFRENDNFNPRFTRINNTESLISPRVLINFYDDTDGQNIEVTNINMLYPCVFLLAPLKHAVASIGYKLTGSFVEDGMIKASFFYSKEHQMTRYTGFAQKTELNFDGVEPEYSEEYECNVKVVTMVVNTIGKYKVSGRMLPQSESRNEMPYIFQDGLDLYKLNYRDNRFFQQHIIKYSINPDDHYDASSGYIEGDYEFEVKDESKVGEILTFTLVPVIEDQFPLIAELTVDYEVDSKTFYQFHPTIELARFIPDWTVGKMLTALMQWRNVDIDVDDNRMEVIINYNNELLLNDDYVDLSGYDFKIGSPQLSSTKFFKLKAKNSDESFIQYGANGIDNVTVQTEYTEEVENEFKFIPSNGLQAVMNNDIEARDGVGIGVYNAINIPIVASGYFDRTLTIDGDKGIFQEDWKTWLRFRLNAKSISVEGALPADVINLIIKKKKVYINHQMYMLRAIEESENGVINPVKIDLESVSF